MIRQCAPQPWEKAGYANPEKWLSSQGIPFVRVWDQQIGTIITMCGAPLGNVKMVDAHEAYQVKLAKMIKDQTIIQPVCRLEAVNCTSTWYCKKNLVCN
jgi:hypothetical protein